MEAEGALTLLERAAFRAAGPQSNGAAFPNEAVDFTLHARVSIPNAKGEAVLAELPGTWRLAVGPAASDCDIQFDLWTTLGQFAVRAPLAVLPATDEHRVVVRFAARHLDLYVDGVLLHQHGTARGAMLAPTGELTVRQDLIRELAAWPAALEDSEIVQLSGGDDAVAETREASQHLATQAFAEAALRVANDPQRPAYHFLPPAFWVNDPNGLVAWKGRFHAFYQHNPYGPYWGTMHWGHAVTDDLLHWEHLPVALKPDADGPDRDGCFSGCCLDVDGTPTLFYTGVFPEVQCRAVGSDDLVRWTREPREPIIAAPPAGLEVTGFRDPWVWREGDEWRMVVGSGLRGQGGFIPLYRSHDLRNWEYLGPLCTGDAARNGTVWECPIFFQIAPNRWALIISPEPLGRVHCLIGTYDGRQLKVLTESILDHGGNFYAPQCPVDHRGRRLLLGWLWEARNDRAQWRAGWSGCFSLPRLLSLGPDDLPRIAPIPEVESLRGAEVRVQGRVLTADTSCHLATGELRQCEIGLVAQTQEGTLVVSFLESASTGEVTRLVYDHAAGELILERGASSLSDDVQRDDRRAPLVLAPSEPLSLRIFVDRSVVEVFANGRVTLTSRVYPTDSGPAAVSIGCRQGVIHLASAVAYPLHL